MIIFFFKWVILSFLLLTNNKYFSVNYFLIKKIVENISFCYTTQIFFSSTKSASKKEKWTKMRRLWVKDKR